MTIVAVHGARGYAGRELIRTLTNHPRVSSLVPISNSTPGEPLGRHVPSLEQAQLTLHDERAAQEADVVFLATNDATATRAMEKLTNDQLVIDLSRAHRQEGLAPDTPWHYGWADLAPAPQGTKRIANPGCYPTSAALAMAPIMRAGLGSDGPIIVDGKSGISGAGATPRGDLHYPEANESVRAYSVEDHDHRSEIQSAVHCMASKSTHVRFTPHLVPQTRGLLTTSYVPAAKGLTDAALEDLVQATYADAPFVRAVDEPNTAHVRGSNHAQVAIHHDADAKLFVARCAIDNLQKGAAGTAIQNMNDAMGWGTTTGLEALAA